MTDSIVLFSNSKVKDEAFKFLDFLFQTPQRVAFTVNEGFLPVEKEESMDAHFTDSACEFSVDRMEKRSGAALAAGGLEQALAANAVPRKALR